MGSLGPKGDLAGRRKARRSRSGTENPHVRAALVEIAENQVRDNDSAETRQPLERLMVAGHRRDHALLLIGAALLAEMRPMLGQRAIFDRARFKWRRDRLR